MKQVSKGLIFPFLLIFLLCITSCSSTNNAITPTASAAPIKSENASFTYKKINESYSDGEIKVKFPQLVKSSNNDKSDSINIGIQSDIRFYIQTLKEEFNSEGKINLTLNYDLSNYKDKAISIAYTGISSEKGAVYPVNNYHTCTIDMESSDFITLKSLFKIDNLFINEFLSGEYIPYTNDLNLEKSNVDIKKAIQDQYTKQDLMKLFSQEEAKFKLTDKTVIISVDVAHALGDHIELAIQLNKLKAFMKDCPLWKDDSTSNKNNSFIYNTYHNSRFAYSIPYPDIYDKSTESDNGDGITFQSTDGFNTMTIWGSYNINNDTGKSLLKEAENRVSHISHRASDAKSYSLDYDGGEEEEPILFHEAGYISNNTIISYILSYRESEKDKYTKAITHITKAQKENKINN